MNKVIAFGDIHGCFQAATTAVRLAKEFNAKAIFLGDYVDRGPSAIQTLRILIEAKQNDPDWIFLRGNHDQMLLDLINGVAKTSDIGAVLGMNYDYNQAAKSFEEWENTNVVEQRVILDFLNDTKFYYETEQLIFCHAVLNDTGNNIQEKTEEELIWNYTYEPIWQGKHFVHGHLPVKKPKQIQKGININTECGYGGVLTGILFNGNDITDARYYHISENGEVINNHNL